MGVSVFIDKRSLGDCADAVANGAALGQIDGGEDPQFYVLGEACHGPGSVPGRRSRGGLSFRVVGVFAREKSASGAHKERYVGGGNRYAGQGS